MAKKGVKKRQNRRALSNRAQNAFNLAQDEEDSRLMRGMEPDIENDSDREGEDGEKPAYRIGEVASEDDEDIDSDEALGSDDEEIFESHRRKSNKNDDDDEEDSDDDGYKSVDESEFVSLSEVWDLDDKDERETSGKDKGSSKERLPNKIDENNLLKLDDEILSDSESEADSESQDDSESEGGSDSEGGSSGSDSVLSDEFSDLDEDDIDEEKLANLKNMISGMSEEALAEATRKAKKQRLQMMNIQESEFALPVGGQKLSLSDLTAGVTTEKKQDSGLKLLENNSKQTLAVPLAKRIQQKNDRKAAYELTKEEVSKWEETVKKNREAEHLQFPINPAPQVSKVAAHAPIEPSTELEKKVNNLLTESNLSEEKSVSTFEELAPSKLTMEEVKRRRNELRLMRELMFREEQKARRIKKIKSKSYRKVHKKERERERMMVEGDEESDRESHDIERARERMSLKHKNTGKWAKRMVEQGFTKDKETRGEMEEMLRRGEDLRKKILDDQDNESDSQEIESAGDDDDDEDDETINEQKESLGKGLLAMKFMKDAEQKERQINKAQREALRNAKNLDDFEDLKDETEDAVNQVVNAGRRKFAPGTSEARDEMLDELEKARDETIIDEEKSLENVITKAFDSRTNSRTKSKSKHSKSQEPDEAEEEEANPWLTISSNSKQKSKKVNIVDKNSSTQSKSQDKLRKEKEKLRSSSNDDSGDIDMNEVLRIVDPLASDNEEGDDDASEAVAEGQNDMKRVPRKGLTFKQRELVKRAFAGDDVVEEFQEEKRQKIADEGDKEIDVTLPGWGSWGGSSIKKKKKVIKKVQGIQADKRQDARLKNVIINEKVNKKSSKYNASSVPFPYENREQYERSLRMPIGREWSSRDTFQKLTKPRVIVKQGTVIDPIKAPFK
ncbi:Utp14p [Sugiyamaella lignohabitans]|uniref:Utp14p n=1 Tax=Sugiyamaella lignohabitans TaxID=796027 RepID=A0A161HIK1_9ASCO|nr:Utp14p [Sugiyamaella lignohabitans]ANB10978.1 Utp14p [Sugiyamaella lignohabitans]